jgi:hypothetical protein
MANLTLNEQELLTWIYLRIVRTYREDPELDWLASFRKIINFNPFAHEPNLVIPENHQPRNPINREERMERRVANQVEQYFKSQGDSIEAIITKSQGNLIEAIITESVQKLVNNELKNIDNYIKNGIEAYFNENLDVVNGHIVQYLENQTDIEKQITNTIETHIEKQVDQSFGLVNFDSTVENEVSEKVKAEFSDLNFDMYIKEALKGYLEENFNEDEIQSKMDDIFSEIRMKIYRIFTN